MGAIISSCGSYRYVLDRPSELELPQFGPAVFVMQTLHQQFQKLMIKQLKVVGILVRREDLLELRLPTYMR